MAAQRAAWGRRRHKRFTERISVGGHDFDRAKVPTIARLFDRLLDLERELEQIVNGAARAVAEADHDDVEAFTDLVEAKRAMLTAVATAYRVRVAAMKEVREGLQKERELARKTPPDDDAGGDDDLGDLKPSPMTTQ